MVARSGKTGAKQYPTCVSIGRIGARELRRRNSARTVMKSEAINAKCVATGASSDKIDAIYVATGAISGATAGTLGTKQTGVKG
jgi:hypothetical protein